MIKDHEFDIDKTEIDEIFTVYHSRKTDEEVDFIAKNHNGINGMCNKLRTNIDKGIIADELDISRRINWFDNNVRPREPLPSFWFYVWESLGDPILRILIVSSIVQISIGASPLSENPKKDWIDGLAIVFAILVIVLTTSVTNYNKEKKFKQLSEINLKRLQVLVRRSGQTLHVQDEDLLVGDIVKIDIGMVIPADGIMINGYQIATDESNLTGETKLVKKNSIEECMELRKSLEQSADSTGKKVVYPSPLLFSGTTIKNGSGWMLVVAVGRNSEGGKITHKVDLSKNDEESNKTPLELKLEDIAEDIGKFGLWAAILTLAALLFKLFYSKYEQMTFHTKEMNAYINQLNNNATNATNATNLSYEGLPDSVWIGIWKDIFSSVILCITIIVVAIPEGLPLAVTLSLSFSVRKMMYDNNLVRKMHACETMGGANYICTDKTGTLTRNAMHVVSIYNNTNEVDVKEVDSNNQSDPSHKFTDKYYSKLKECLINNLDIELDEKNQIIIESSSKTDFAFYDLFKGFGEDIKRNPNEFVRFPFNSNRKKMSTIVKLSSNQYRIYLKGAPDIILSAVNSYVHPRTDEIINMTLNDLNKFKDIIRGFGVKLLRSIAFAYKDVNASTAESYKDGLNLNNNSGSYAIEESGFTLIGISGIADTLRQGVEHSVAACHHAGVNVVMITGDNMETAVAIAKSAGILRRTEDFHALTGLDFYNKIGGFICAVCNLENDKCECPRSLSEAQEKFGDDKDDEFYQSKLYKERIKYINTFRKIVSNLKVLARARPIDKYALVLGLRELGNVVAVTGDGTNDAPALSKADVGFAMGQTGTDVARNAADIIILDDNFNSIVHAIKWGRNIFDNIRKFIQFQLSVNLSAVLLVFVSSCIGSESPISAIQMLWINLIMDSLGSLALATESPSDDLLRRKPHSKREYIISSRMWKHITFQSLFQFLLVFFLYMYGSYYIMENDPSRIYITDQFENCFGEFPGEVLKFEHHALKYFVLDGKKSSWDPLRRIKKNIDPELCMFYNKELFPAGKEIKNLYHAFKWYNSEYGNTAHMTIIFNAFVIYALFNQINSRILDDSYNIFKGFFKNWMFLAILLVEVIAQFCIVQYGGILFKCAVGGLTRYQWLVCVGLGSMSLVLSAILKSIRLEVIFEFNYKNFLRRCCMKRRIPRKGLDQNLMNASMNSEYDDIERAERRLEMRNLGTSTDKIRPTE